MITLYDFKKSFHFLFYIDFDLNGIKLLNKKNLICVLI